MAGSGESFPVVFHPPIEHVAKSASIGRTGDVYSSKTVVDHGGGGVVVLVAVAVPSLPARSSLKCCFGIRDDCPFLRYDDTERLFPL